MDIISIHNLDTTFYMSNYEVWLRQWHRVTRNPQTEALVGHGPESFSLSHKPLSCLSNKFY